MRYVPLSDTQILKNVLVKVCEDTHDSCDYRCPVWDAMNIKERESKECPCFKDGSKMLKFLKSRKA